MNIYDFTITTGKGEQLNLADYKGRVILVVNTATGCGFTPQYEPIEHPQGRRCRRKALLAHALVPCLRRCAAP